MKNLQNPYALYDERGNIIHDRKDVLSQWKSTKRTYFLLKRWEMPISRYIKILLCTLTFALFFERYCFAVAVYKTKNYGYVLINMVIMTNTLFLSVISRLRRKKHKKRLHELYSIDRAPKVGWCVIGFVGVLDMLKSFFLFYPANVLPMWLLICLLQLFIPLNMLLRTCCIDEVSQYKIHWLSSLTILLGCIISMFTLGGDPEHPPEIPYGLCAGLIILSSLLDVVSHTTKEVIVRS